MISPLEAPPAPAAALPGPWQTYNPAAPGLLAGTDTPAPPAMEAPPAIEAPPFPESVPVLKTEVPPVWEFPPNDDGRAAFFLTHFGAGLRYVPELSLWRIWHGHQWHDDTTGRAGHFCQLLSRNQLEAAAALRSELATELAAQIDSGNAESGRKLKRSDVERESARADKHAAALGNEKTIAALLAAASRTPGVIVPLSAWDADPWLVGTENGTLDLRNGTHRAGAPGDYITRRLAVTWDPDAAAPAWGKFIARVLPPAVAEYIQRIAGYSLTGHTDDQAFYFLYGKGCNGKSILVTTLAAILNGYAKHAPRNLIEQPSHGGGCKNEIAHLPGARFLYGEETREGAIREDVIKALTSGMDTLTGEKKYCDEFSFRPVAKLWIMGNEKPSVRGTDDGIWRRIRLIPFTEKITDEEKIPHAELMATLAAERAGILNWMLAGLASIRPSLRIPVPLVVKAASDEYRADEDPLSDFIAECTRDAAPNYSESKQKLFDAYLRWSAENGIRLPLTQKKFTARLKDREGWSLCAGRRGWVGKSIRPDDQ